MSPMSVILTKSWAHSASRSFQHQVTRLKAPSYPTTLLTSVAESLQNTTAKKLEKSPERHATQDSSSPFVVIPYMSRAAHNQKGAAQKYGVRVIFSSPNKLVSLCQKINRGRKERRQWGTKEHATGRVSCQSNESTAPPSQLLLMNISP